MEKILLLFILLSTFSCTQNIEKNLQIDKSTPISEIEIDLSDINIGTGTYNDTMENTTDEEIDELIDILFETSYND